ncbi:MAG TPA: RHS repeat-associated core domain-containing protein [Flavobacterium sp.]
MNRGFYSAGQLYKTITKDENWTGTTDPATNHTTEEFKDKEGRVVLKRTYSTVNNVSEAHDTYYVYDIYGNLTYVLPPKASAGISNSNRERDITNSTVTAPGSTLQLSATHSITLLPGFNAQEGSTFTATIVPGNLDDLCYQYKYDHRNRLVEKKLPGKGWEYIVYDKLDRPVLTQDANLRAQNKWLFTKYDAFSRPVYTGDYTNTTQTTRADMQGLTTAATVLYEARQGATVINRSTAYYSNNAFPNVANINLFTIAYYDDYGFDLNGGTAEDSYGITPSTRTKGLTTGTKTRVLDTDAWVTGITYYDDKARPIYNYSKNDYLQTTDKVKLQLNFTGKTLQTTSAHYKRTRYNDVDITVTVDTYTYDHADRLLSQKQTINGQPEETIVVNTYDELGQLIGKGVGGKTTQGRLQNVDYGYNIQGWLKTINNPDAIGSDLFTFRLHYNDPANTTPALYNGNISQAYWKTANSDNSLKNYNYRYDALNRLTFATDNLDRYSENLNYDKNGNIMDLVRKGATNPNATAFGIMDQLTYRYDAGNKLLKVEDTAGEEGFKDGTSVGNDYIYDNNGNMISDANKGISSITYNHLNLPVEITFSTGGVITYTYDATGVKLQKTINSPIQTSRVTQYAGAYQYEKFGRLDFGLKFFSQPEGYVAHNSGIFSYIYQYKDHLGNNRLSYSDSNDDGQVTASEIVEEDNYYPFGLKHKGYNSIINGVAHMYKYNGKELQKELGLNMYDYGARNYDPALGRWMNIDPLAEKSRRFSPYAYALNNPVFFIDPDGMMARPPLDYYNQSGDRIGTDGVNDGRKAVVTDNSQARAIKRTDRSGGTTELSGVSSAVVLPSDTVLQESLNVLQRTTDNGGLSEESSIVMNDGTVVQGERGSAVRFGTDQYAGATLPNLPEGSATTDVQATIHSHPTSHAVIGEQVFSSSALAPSVPSDRTTFAQFSTNIIVGR